MAFESLLGAWVAESDLARRWEIILPEGEIIVFAFVPAELGPLFLTDGLSGGSIRCSVGVGGVTVVAGVSRESLVGGLGVVLMAGRSRLLLLALPRSVLLLKKASDSCDPDPMFTVFLLSPVPNNPPRGFPLPEDLADARSGLFGGLVLFFRDEPTAKTSLIRAPGETPRLLLPSGVPRDKSLLMGSAVEACRGARFVDEDVVLCVVGNVPVL